MTNTDLVSKYPAFVLGLLRQVRVESGPSGTAVNLEFHIRALDTLVGDFVGSDLVMELRDRGLLQHALSGMGWTTSPQADRLLDQIDAEGAQLLNEFEACLYDFAHTRHWCGNRFCRDS